LVGGAGQLERLGFAAQAVLGFGPVGFEQGLFAAAQFVGHDGAADGVEQGLAAVHAAQGAVEADPAPVAAGHVVVVGPVGVGVQQPVVDRAGEHGEGLGEGEVDQQGLVPGEQAGGAVVVGAGQVAHVGGADVAGRPRRRRQGHLFELAAQPQHRPALRLGEAGVAGQAGRPRLGVVGREHPPPVPGVAEPGVGRFQGRAQAVQLHHGLGQLVVAQVAGVDLQPTRVGRDFISMNIPWTNEQTA
jgi:hypothetical protein